MICLTNSPCPRNLSLSNKYLRGSRNPFAAWIEDAHLQSNQVTPAKGVISQAGKCWQTRNMELWITLASSMWQSKAVAIAEVSMLADFVGRPKQSAPCGPVRYKEQCPGLVRLREPKGKIFKRNAWQFSVFWSFSVFFVFWPKEFGVWIVEPCCWLKYHTPVMRVEFSGQEDLSWPIRSRNSRRSFLPHL